MKNENTLKNLSEQDKTLSENLYKLTRGQAEVYNWLRVQGLNTDNNKLNYWSRQYPAKAKSLKLYNSRMQDVKLVKLFETLEVGFVNCLRRVLQFQMTYETRSLKLDNSFIKTKEWKDLNIYEKYVKDMVTGDDLPLTMDNKDFNRALEALYRKSQLYKSQ